MRDAFVWTWVVVIFCVLVFGLVGLMRWLWDDATRKPAQTRDRRALKRS